MIKVGLTGGIGSGKSTVCRIWEKLGAKVIYADELAKQLMETDSSLKNKIIKAFGNKSYNKNGRLNREYLANEAFEKGRVEEFNALIHPRVLAETRKLAEDAENEGYDVFVKEAALLVKYGRPTDLDIIVVVTADEKKRIDRVQKRDNVRGDSVQQRIKKQQPEKELLHFADFVINNNGTIEQLKGKAVYLYAQLIAKEI